jgi:hypothetical protein
MSSLHAANVNSDHTSCSWQLGPFNLPDTTDLTGEACQDYRSKCILNTVTIHYHNRNQRGVTF